MVLPIHDINPLSRRPYVTWALIAINVVVFVFLEPVVTSIGGITTAKPATVCEQRRFFDHWAAIPKELLENNPLSVVPSGEVVPISTGQLACVAEEPPKFHKSPFVSVLTAMFLHGSWLHLIGNMLFLGVFGNNIEDRMGRGRFLGFYLLSGYIATYACALIEGHSQTPVIGASGAIAGVLGSYLVVFPRAKVIGLFTFLFFLPFWLPAWIVLGSWFLLQYLYVSGVGVAAGGGVAYGAHVAGFLFGVLVTLPFIRPLRAAGPKHPVHPPSHPWIRHLPLPRWAANGRHADPGGLAVRGMPLTAETLTAVRDRVGTAVRERVRGAVATRRRPRSSDHPDGPPYNDEYTGDEYTGDRYDERADDDRRDDDGRYGVGQYEGGRYDDERSDGDDDRYRGG